MSAPDPFTSYDAAYVLGALSPQDRSDYEAHLPECERCARAVRELAGMPGLLGLLGHPTAGRPAAGAHSPGAQPDSQGPGAQPDGQGPGDGPGTGSGAWPVRQPPPATLLPALLAGVAAARRRQRRRTALLTAGLALTACLALLLVLLAPGDDPAGEDGTSPVPIAMTSLVEYPVEATVRLDETEQGTQVDMDCSYGTDESAEYVLVAVTRDGEDRELATWVTAPDYTVSISVGTTLRRTDITALEVRSTQGYPVLRASVPEAR